MVNPEITLIVPPRSLDVMTNSSLQINVKRFPSLGLGYIAAVLEKNGFPVRFIDMYALDLSIKEFKAMLKEKPPTIIGITCDTSTIVSVKKIASFIKKRYSACIVIVGGIHPTLFPDETINAGMFDVVVLGEGELTMLELVQSIESGNDLEDVKGILFKKDGKIIKTQPRPIIDNLDEIPFPARHLMPRERYTSALTRNSQMTTIISSRGCPFNCLFCVLSSRWRGRSPENVVDEIQQVVVNFGIKEFFFEDSTMTLEKTRVIRMCKEIVRRKLPIIWQCSTRADCVNQDLLFWMRRAGCTRIQYGIESGDPRILKTLQKRITIKQARDAIYWSKRAGLETFLFFMIGSPGETMETINRTINFAKELDSDFVGFSIAVPMPGTALFDLAVENGILDRDYWKNYAQKGESKMPGPIFQSTTMNQKIVSKMLKRAYFSFYFRPRYIIKRIFKVKSISEFKNNVNGFKSMLIEIFTGAGSSVFHLFNTISKLP